MSHFSRIRTQMVEKEPLLAALADLGYAYEEGDVEIRGWLGRRVRVEIKIPSRNPGYDVGFRKQGAPGAEAYECVADWYGVRGISQERFLRELAQRYAYQVARAKLEEQGFTLVNEETQKDGRIHLVLRRMA